MNPYRIYRDEWARALAIQATAAAYATFVAMPFDERFSYRSRDILRSVIGVAIDEANRQAETRRTFAKAERVDVPSDWRHARIGVVLVECLPATPVASRQRSSTSMRRAVSVSAPAGVVVGASSGSSVAS